MLVTCFGLMTIIATGGGGGSDSSSDGGDSSGDNGQLSAYVLAVDPYIVGVKFCEDKNDNGTCDDGEQISTASGSDGLCGFENELTAGSTLIIHTQGTHNGVTYDINIAREISQSDITGAETLVISPLTTLTARGLTNDQVAEILQTAGLTNITASDISGNPMESVADLTSGLTEAQLARIRSSIVVYAFLKIRRGSNALQNLTAAQLYASAMDTDTGAVYNILSTMVFIVRNAISPTTLSTVEGYFPDNLPITLPSITAGDFIQTAVTITNYIASVGYETCNANNGNVTVALAAVEAAITTSTLGDKIETWSLKLGQRYYAYRNRNTLLPYSSAISNYVSDPGPLLAGLNSQNGIFVVNDSGEIEDYSSD